MKIIIILTAMIIYDFSLHLAELAGKVSWHPLYIAPILKIIPYDIFWTVYWGSACLILLTIIGGKNANLRKKKKTNAR